MFPPIDNRVSEARTSSAFLPADKPHQRSPLLAVLVVSVVSSESLMLQAANGNHSSIKSKSLGKRDLRRKNLSRSLAFFSSRKSRTDALIYALINSFNVIDTTSRSSEYSDTAHSSAHFITQPFPLSPLSLSYCSPKGAGRSY